MNRGREARVNGRGSARQPTQRRPSSAALPQGSAAGARSGVLGWPRPRRAAQQPDPGLSQQSEQPHRRPIGDRCQLSRCGAERHLPFARSLDDNSGTPTTRRGADAVHRPLRWTKAEIDHRQAAPLAIRRSPAGAAAGFLLPPSANPPALRRPLANRPIHTATAAAHCAPRGASTTGGTITFANRLDITLSLQMNTGQGRDEQILGFSPRIYELQCEIEASPSRMTRLPT